MKWSPKKIIIGVLLVAALGVVFAGATHHLFKLANEKSSAGANANGERKVLYWYDAMNPQHHYNKPGKAPDGMDLLPQYAEQTASPAGAQPSGDMASMPGMSNGPS